jgi:hypothetical protein
MSMANESEEAPRDDGAQRTPSDSGWSLWSGGSCSITRCLDQPVTAIERSRGLRRPPYLQPYCAEHAGARGVERVGDELVWTAAFLQPRGRISSRNRQNSTAIADS